MDRKDLLEKYINYLSKNEISYPISSLDYSSLYPSLIMCFNLSPEYLIKDEAYKEELEKKGYPIHSINFNYDYLNYKEEKCSKTITGWTVRHDESLPENTRFGLYPTILKDLFAQRAEMKKNLFVYKEKKEHMEKYVDNYINDPEYVDCLFKLKYSDTKQKALKVFMNTFYGELGNKNSPLFILELAGGVTSAGQNNLLKVKKLVEDLDHEIYYGDTDSLYMSCPPRHYKELDKEYYTNCIDKEKYCTELVNITFKFIEDIKTKVNNYLYEDNGTKYLKMAYEEVLYPVIFLSKKKYYGIAHEGIPNFKPKDMFIRGLEVKKRGVSELLRINCTDIMWNSLDIYNKKTLRELVLNKIQYLFTKKWDLCDFIQTGLWKPEKQNVTLNKFVDRMKLEGKQLPEPYERFNYVLVKIDDPRKLYDLRGCKITISKSDKMEYMDIAEKDNKSIDLEYYFEKQLIGQFARLMSYDTEFHVYTYEDGVLELNDDKTMNKCKKYLLSIASNYTDVASDYGKLYKQIFRTINSKYKEKKTSHMKLNKKFSILFNSQSEEDTIDNMVLNNINNYLANKDISDEAKKIIKNIKAESENVLIKLYNNRPDSYYSKQIKELTVNLNNALNDFITVVKKHNLEDMLFNVSDIGVISIIKNIRNKYNIDEKCKNKEINSIEDILSEEDLNKEIEEANETINMESLTEVYNKYISIIAIKKNILLLREIQTIYYNSIANQGGYLNTPKNFRL